MDDFWEEVADIQFDESALAEAIYISAARDSRTLPVGCSPDHFRQAVYHLPGFPLAARAGSDWLLWYLKVLCKLYFPNYSHESDEIDLLARIMADRWYASQIIKPHKGKLDRELIEELMDWLINDVQPGYAGDVDCFPVSGQMKSVPASARQDILLCSPPICLATISSWHYHCKAWSHLGFSVTEWEGRERKVSTSENRRAVFTGISRIPPASGT